MSVIAQILHLTNALSQYLSGSAPVQVRKNTGCADNLRTRGKKSGDKMFEIDFRSRIPIYEQIKNEILMCIRLGVYKPDEQLPSIRSVSQSTGINVNTVKRAFADLEDEGVIYTLVGRGSFVSSDAAENTSIADKALEEIETDIRSLKSKGVTRDSLIRLIDSIYSEEMK